MPTPKASTNRKSATGPGPEGRADGLDRFPIRVDAATTVSALVLRPHSARACLTLAHGAGAGMEHPFMRDVAEGLAARAIATLRYQFPYMERGMKRTDPSAVCHLTVQAALAQAARRLGDLPSFAGGKSFGGRMTSQIQSTDPLPRVRGLVFFGFPLHPAGQPATARAQHLAEVTIPMLFLQGARDTLAELPLLRRVLEPLGPRATLDVVDDADHSFHVPARSGKSDATALGAMLDVAAAWMLALAD